MELSTLVERVAAEALLFAVEDCKGGELGLMRLVESLGLGLLLWSIEDVPIDEMELTKGVERSAWEELLFAENWMSDVKELAGLIERLATGASYWSVDETVNDAIRLAEG